MNVNEFVGLVGALAREDWKERRLCLPSIVTAIAIESSDWGRSLAARERNALFSHVEGIRKETYNSLKEAIRAHNTHIAIRREGKQESPNWGKVIGESNYIRAIQFLQDAKYPYHPFKFYETQIIELIEAFDLDRFDETQEDL